MSAVRLTLLEVETLWEVDGDRRLVRSRPGDWREPPRLVVASDGEALVWSCSAVVPDSIVESVDRALADEPAVPPMPGDRWEPACRDEVVEALGPLADIWCGVSYVVREPPGVAADVAWIAGLDAASCDELVGRMPERDRSSLAPPWAAVMVDGRVAAVCETARSAPRSVEAGVWTYEPFRRRGLGAAAVAAWSTLVAGRTTFYSTSADNLASQALAASLGLRPLAVWWQLYA
jgi:hypothetical protein